MGSLMADTQRHPAVVLEVHDGDTVKMSVRLAKTRMPDHDLGFHIYAEHGFIVLHTSVRLLGCNAIELRNPGGPEAQQNLAALLPAGLHVMLSTVLDDKYGGRVDATVTLPDGTDLVTALIVGQWAAPWDGLGPKPTPPWPRTI